MKAEYKIIADHLRSSSFLIADGVLPSNEGRGYVLRRIMRRAMRQLHKLGVRENSMYKFVDALIAEMSGAYPELSRARELIIDVLKNEEEKFRETLEKGLKILEENLKETKNNIFSGKIAFKLYDTYGFPLDLTEDILREKNLKVNLEEFNQEMEEQKNRAKASWKGSGEESLNSEFLALKDKFGETKFLGYETLESKAKILVISSNDDGGYLVLDQTPFYATSGGQKGDSGKIFNDKNEEIEIIETKKFNGVFVHFFKGENNLKDEDGIIAKVDPSQRKAKARAHSATHLMHKALKEILGNVISQKGSNVGSDYLTFDFNLNRAMTKDEIKKVEDFVNQQIKKSAKVETKIMDIEKARASGAEALFGEKYDDEVRVVAMGINDASTPYSVELCGGTHVKNTAEIEDFKIISENGIAAGIRRIAAVSGKEQVAEKNREEELIKQNEIKKQEEIKKQKELEKLKKQNLLANLNCIKSENIGDTKVIHHIFSDLEAKDLRDVINSLKSRAEFSNSCIFILFATQENKVSVCVAISDNLVDKYDATKLISPIVLAIGGNGGGGKKDFAMGGGNNIEGASQAVAIIKNLLK